MKFLSPDWLAEVNQVIEKEITTVHSAFINTPLLVIIQKCPDGSEKTLFFDPLGDASARIKLVEHPHPIAEFKVNGNYLTIQQVLTNKSDPISVLMKGELSIEGNLMRALSMTSVFESLFKQLSSVPCEF
jgi:putative sterol carrier protein